MDYLAKLHWDAVIQQHIDPDSEKAKAAILEFNKALARWLEAIGHSLEPPQPPDDSEVLNFPV